MAFRKATAEDIKKFVSINSSNPKMNPETRELIEAFRALELDTKDAYLVLDVEDGRDRTTVRSNWLTKLKAYLPDSEWKQVEIMSPVEDDHIIILRKVTKQQKAA